MPTLQPGDIFLLNSGGWLNKTIDFFQALYSGDHKSDYIHSGVILDAEGKTFETTPWRTGNQNLFTTYPGSILLIARWKGITPTGLVSGYGTVRDQMGKIYPYHRLLLFAVHLARWIHWNGKVCSELVSAFLNGAGFTRQVWGVNVDDLHDEIVNNPAAWTIVFEEDMHTWTAG